MANNDKNYHKTRFKFDPGRAKVWRAITEYLQPYVGVNKTVLDLGAGYGDFIRVASHESGERIRAPRNRDVDNCFVFIFF